MSSLFTFAYLVLFNYFMCLYHQHLLLYPSAGQVQSLIEIGKVLLGHSPTTFLNTEICQYEREFCHKWLILYSSFN